MAEAKRRLSVPLTDGEADALGQGGSQAETALRFMKQGIGMAHMLQSGGEIIHRTKDGKETIIADSETNLVYDPKG